MVKGCKDQKISHHYDNISFHKVKTKERIYQKLYEYMDIKITAKK